MRPSNILLDASLEAKVAHFGRSPGQADSSMNESTDVYSFGVMLLELVSGRLRESGEGGSGLESLAEQVPTRTLWALTTGCEAIQ